MRVTIQIDSASTERVRELAKALNAVGLTGQLMVGLDGPECWKATTPVLTFDQYAEVSARLVN